MSSSFQQLPPELQVRILTHLRAVDLSRLTAVSRYYWTNARLTHAIVEEFAETIYTPRFSQGFAQEPVSSGNSKGNTTTTFTFEHLKNMELLVVARVLNTPEPKTGFVVSKSWCKTALQWLETQRPTSSSKRKKKRKKKIVPTIPPPNDINSDITCLHDNLCHLTSTRSARARRRLLDKKAWKILQVLYPESTTIDSRSGECVLCQAERFQALKNEQDKIERANTIRKAPLAASPELRKFYARSRGVPEECLSQSSIGGGGCPLIPGTYHVLPRNWCREWRKYLRNGTEVSFRAPDSSELLCEIHKLALLPPHLEQYLHGESTVLLAGKPVVPVAAAIAPPRGGPSLESLQAMRALGLTEDEIALQTRALRTIEERRRREEATRGNDNNRSSIGQVLDRENYTVVEILSAAEFQALQSYWPDASIFSLVFVVGSLPDSSDNYYRIGDSIWVSSPICRDCEASGRPTCNVSFRNRSRKKPSAARLPRVEY